MAELSVQRAEQAPAKAAAQKAARLFYVDNLRIALVILVVLHHVAMVYGASAPFYYVEPPFTDPTAFQVLLIFALVNQAWFMGAFFLLAGYFTPGSLDRKGAGSFLKERLLRLGVPLLVYIFVLNPISELGVYLMPATLTGITEPLTWAGFWQVYPDLLGLGPLWFIAMLLTFTIGYAIWRMLTGSGVVRARSTTAPGYLAVTVFTLLLAVVSFLVRRVVPLGQSTTLFVDALSFPTIAYLPQYIGFFAIGVVAARHDWLRTLPNAMGIFGLAAAATVMVLLFPLAISGQMFSVEVSEALGNAMGNGHWQSAAYTLWDAIFSVGISLAAIALFRRFFNGQWGIGRFLSKHGYAVYIVHIPIIITIAYALRAVEIGGISKFGVVSAIVIPVCFAVAFIIRKLPLADRVL